MEQPLEFATRLARKVGRVLLEHLGDEQSSRLKPDLSIVTQADLAADRLIAASIQKNYPGEPIVSEELHPQLSGDPSGGMWIIDPLDGTTNYSLGLPFWGISIARLVRGWPQSAVLYFPQLDELYSAQLGLGATFNDEPLKVKSPSLERHAAFFSCCSRTYRNYDVTIPYKPRILGSAVYSLSCVARNIALIGFEATPKIWDIAGVWLLVMEAGGSIQTLDGSQPFPVRPGIDYTRASFPTLAADTPELISWARGKIKAKKEIS